MTGPVLTVQAVHQRHGDTPVLRGATLALQPGERLALIGPNGAGKSTLFDVVSGRTALQSGEVRLQGRRIDGLSPQRIQRLGLSRSFQASRLFGRMTVAEHLECALMAPLGLGGWSWRSTRRLPALQARTGVWLDRLSLQARRDWPAQALSYAEQRVLELGLTLAGDAPVVLLDEPTAGMSQRETAAFVDRLRTLTAGRSLLIVEHDMGVVFGLADRVAVLVQGEVIACDRPERVRADPRVQQAYLGVDVGVDSRRELRVDPGGPR